MNVTFDQDDLLLCGACRLDITGAVRFYINAHRKLKKLDPYPFKTRMT